MPINKKTVSETITDIIGLSIFAIMNVTFSSDEPEETALFFFLSTAYYCQQELKTLRENTNLQPILEPILSMVYGALAWGTIKIMAIGVGNESSQDDTNSTESILDSSSMDSTNSSADENVLMALAILLPALCTLVKITVNLWPEDPKDPYEISDKELNNAEKMAGNMLSSLNDGSSEEDNLAVARDYVQLCGNHLVPRENELTEVEITRRVLESEMKAKETLVLMTRRAKTNVEYRKWMKAHLTEITRSEQDLNVTTESSALGETDTDHNAAQRVAGPSSSSTYS